MRSAEYVVRFSAGLAAYQQLCGVGRYVADGPGGAGPDVANTLPDAGALRQQIDGACGARSHGGAPTHTAARGGEPTAFVPLICSGGKSDQIDISSQRRDNEF